jgi:probable phosphoglycerate mutase
LWLIRHGQSAGNVARDDAERRGLPTIHIDGRDIDVPLSALGRHQARAVGRWFARMPREERFGVVLSSPYARAVQTAELVVEESGLRGTRIVLDERLREKDFGSLNRLTTLGIARSFPEEAERRALVGKFYYRPPGGESWCDVILRARSVLDDVQLRHGGERVLLVVHQVVVLCFRYVLEDLDEASVLAIDRQGDVANCAVTTFEAVRDRMELRQYNFAAPRDAEGAPVTRTPDTAMKP